MVTVTSGDRDVLKAADFGILLQTNEMSIPEADSRHTDCSLSKTILAIHQSRTMIFRMRTYAIYACASTIRVVLSFSLLTFIFHLDFPPFMVLIITMLNYDTVYTITDDSIHSSEPEILDIAEILCFATAYGLHLTLSTLVVD